MRLRTILTTLALPLAVGACGSESNGSGATAAVTVAPTDVVGATSVEPVPNTPFVDAFITSECGPLPADVAGIVVMLRDRLADVQFADVVVPEAGDSTIRVQVPRTATDVDPATICATPTFEIRPVLATGSGSFVDVDGSSLDLGPALVSESPFTPSVSVEQLDTGQWAANASLTAPGATAVSAAAAHCFAADDTCPTRRFALVLDGKVITSPTVMAPTFGDSLQIVGDFSKDGMLAIAAGLEAASVGFGLLTTSG